MASKSREAELNGKQPQSFGAVLPRLPISPGGTTVPHGTIKKIISEKGFGFIEGSNGKDIFFHRSVVADSGFSALKKGQLIEFEFAEDDGNGKGPRAKVVRTASGAAAAIHKLLS